MHNNNAFGEESNKHIPKRLDLNGDVDPRTTQLEVRGLLDKTLHALLNIADIMPALCNGADTEFRPVRSLQLTCSSNFSPALVSCESFRLSYSNLYPV